MRNLITQLSAAAFVAASLCGGVLQAQDSPPTQLLADFEGGIGTNNYGGEVRGFYGLGNPFAQDDSQVVSTFPTTAGVSGGGAWQVTDPVGLVEGADFTFFGMAMGLSLPGTAPNNFSVPQNISVFANLEISVQLGPTADAHNDWLIRLEDVDVTGGGEFNNVTLELDQYHPTTPGEPAGEPVTGSYTTYVIPLTDFTIGAQPVDLTRVAELVFANGTLNPATSGSERIDLLIDRIELTGTGTPIFQSPPTPLFDDFEDLDLVNNYGGTAAGFYGFGNPFTQNDGAITNAVVADGGDNAWSATGSLAAGADFTFFGHQVGLADAGGNDITGFNTLRFDARVGTGTAYTDYQVRFEDTDVTGGGEFNNNLVALSSYGTLGTTYSTFSIPLADFLGGAQDPDFTLASVLVLANGALGAGPFEIDLFIDNLELTSVFDAPPTALQADFNVTAIQQGLNNYGGNIGAFQGGGEALIVTFPDMSGATGAPGDAAWRLSTEFDGPMAGAGFFGQFMRLLPEADDDMVNNVDISGFDRLAFKARIGNPGDFTAWDVRIEDTTGSSFNAFSLPLANYGTITDSGYVQFNIPLADFAAGTGASGGSSAVDLTQTRVVVFAGTPGASEEVDLFIDDVIIQAGNLGVNDWVLYE